MADPNIFIVDTSNPAEVSGVISDEVAAPTEPKPADEALTDAPEIQAKAGPRKDRGQ
jgi:hypothetical protein